METTVRTFNKKEMEVMLSSLLIVQVVTEAYEAMVFDLCKTWQSPPVLVKDELQIILDTLVVELVNRLKEEDKNYGPKCEQERFEDNQVNDESDK